MTTFLLSHTLHAPRTKVWDAWTQKDQLIKWFGPKGFAIKHAELNLSVGGIFHYGIEVPGSIMWGRWTFRDIIAPDKLEFVFSFSDETGKTITRHPWSPNWPLEVASVVTLSENQEFTEVVLTAETVNATPAEQQAFDAGQSSMQQGWLGTFEQLELFLKR